MALKCGIVGLPNVGKSTFFNALTQAGIDAANFPFCTIEPNVGMVHVPDPRLNQIADIAQSKNVIPAAMQFFDIAGLVAGASKGEGLGNQFLSHIRQTQAIVHMVRCFENDDITHVSGRVNPLADIEVIQTELALSDIQTLEKASLKLSKLARSGDKSAAAEEKLISEIKACLNELDIVKLKILAKEHAESIEKWHLLSIKPVLYVANVSDQSDKDRERVAQVSAKAAQEGAQLVVISCAIESEIIQLEAEDRALFLEEMGLEEPGLHRVIRSAYHLLGLQTYFTAGEKEARAWTIPVGSSAPQAAGVIHSDFEHGFIRAEVIAYDDYIAHRGETAAKEAGKWRLEGKDYIVSDGDVVHFRFNV